MRLLRRSQGPRETSKKGLGGVRYSSNSQNNSITNFAQVGSNANVIEYASKDY